jgi:hypothetical protein
MKTAKNKPSPATQINLLAVSVVMDKSNDIINSLQNLFFVWMSFVFFLCFFETRCDATQPLELGYGMGAALNITALVRLPDSHPA